MIPTNRNFSLKACALLTVFAGRLLFAQQLGHYIGGFTGLENGTSPPPGFYGAAFGLVEPIQSIKGPNGNTVLKPDINVGGVIAAYIVTTPKKILRR